MEKQTMEHRSVGIPVELASVLMDYYCFILFTLLNITSFFIWLPFYRIHQNRTVTASVIAVLEALINLPQ